MVVPNICSDAKVSEFYLVSCNGTKTVCQNKSFSDFNCENIHRFKKSNTGKKTICHFTILDAGMTVPQYAEKQET